MIWIFIEIRKTVSFLSLLSKNQEDGNRFKLLDYANYNNDAEDEIGPKRIENIFVQCILY